MKHFPVVKASGSHYEVGKAIGKKMGNTINRLLKREKHETLDNISVFTDEAKKYFPQYVLELQGVADGAGISFNELFYYNCREALDVAADHCTIIAIPKGDGYILGHNEDWDASSLELLYVFDGTINGTKIFGLNYADSLLGDSVAINGHGLIEAVNDLSHHDAQVGVPRKFIARAILDCKTLEEAEDLIKKIPRAAGYNHVLVQGERLWNIESSAKEYVIEKIEDQKYIHTNHYLTELKRIDRGNKESVARYEKVKSLLASINTIDDVKTVLCDRKDPQVCRPGTIGSVILDPQTAQRT